MHHARTTFLICLLCIVVDSSVLAQQDAGPGFDPTPVEIPNIQKGPPRAVTKMDLLNLRDLHGIQISPDGRYVAFVLGQAVYETNSYRSGLFVIGTEQGSKALGLGTAGPPNWDAMNQWLPENPQWSAHSKYLYLRVKHSGIWQVWKWNREGGVPIQLTHMEHDVKSFRISPDSTKLIMTVEGPSAIEKKQFAERGILYDGSIDEFGPKPILDRIAQMRAKENQTWIHDLRDGSEQKASSEELEAYGISENDPNGAILNKIFSTKEIAERHVYGLLPSPDKNRVVFMGYVDDFRESAWMSWLLFVKSMDGGSPVEIKRWAYYGGQYWWSPNSKEVYYTEDDPENVSKMRTKIMVVAATGGKPRLMFQSPGFLHDYSADLSGRLLGCIRENTTTPPEIALVDLANGKVRTLVDLNPEFQNLQLSPARQIDVSNKYGDHFWGHLVFPLGYEPGKRYPLIITTYRDFGGFLRGGLPGDEYPIQVFAANGFAVLNFEALGRLRNNKPNDFDSTILFWESPIDGLKTALSKLWYMGLVDRSRIGITGLSHGAVVVDYGISHTDLFHAAIDSGGGSRDPLTFYLLSDGDRASFSHLWDLELPENDSLARWQRISPALNAHRVRAPLLINTADAEYIADMQLVITLRELKKPVEMFIYPNEQHLKNQPRHRYEIYERNVDWFNFWLQNREDPDPAKADLYKRWRELRQLQENRHETATPKP